MPTQSDTNVIVALLQSINGKVDNISDQVNAMSTRLAVVEAQRSEEKIEDVQEDIKDHNNRLLRIETQSGVKDRVWNWAIGFLTSVGLAFIAKMFDFFK